MGYTYQKDPVTNRQRLVCDSCDAIGAVKRVCPHHVFYPDGTSLPMCPPPALCGMCYKQQGGKYKIHEHCKAAAAKRQETVNREAAQLARGDFKVSSAWGDWHDSVPSGHVGVLFMNRLGVQVFRLMKDTCYDAHKWLSEYSDTKPWCGPDERCAYGKNHKHEDCDYRCLGERPT